MTAAPLIVSAAGVAVTVSAGIALCKVEAKVLIDRFEDKQIDGHLREKFSIGLTGLPYSKEHRPERIVGFHYAAVGQSHFSSIIDIVLGTFRFAINAFTRHDAAKLDSAKRLLETDDLIFDKE